MAPSRAARAASDAARRQHTGRILVALTCASGSFALMQAVIVPALPIVQHELGTSTEWAAWTISIYLLSASVATPLLGRLGDQFGKDRMLLVTLGLFTLGSILSIFAWNISSLIVFQALKGSAARCIRSVSPSFATRCRRPGWGWRWA
jgi:predicted MFS family arabinose efflux permease